MKKIPAKQFTIYDPIFGQSITVFINRQEADFMRWQKRLNIVNAEGFDANFQAFTTHVSGEGEPNKYVIWLTHFNWTLDDQSSLIHEIIHAVTRIWQANNISFSPE